MEDDLFGVRTAEVSNWTGKAVAGKTVLVLGKKILISECLNRRVN